LDESLFLPRKSYCGCARNANLSFSARALAVLYVIFHTSRERVAFLPIPSAPTESHPFALCVYIFGGRERKLKCDVPPQDWRHARINSDESKACCIHTHTHSHLATLPAFCSLRERCKTNNPQTHPLELASGDEFRLGNEPPLLG
jgi:hypothetical protein